MDKLQFVVHLGRGLVARVSSRFSASIETRKMFYIHTIANVLGSITNRVDKLQFVEEIRATNANKMSEAQANWGRRVPASALPTWG